MSMNEDKFAKSFTAISPSEIIQWTDVFSNITKLSPSNSLSIYAELCLFEDVDLLFAVAADRKSKIILAEKLEEIGEYESDSMSAEDLISVFTDSYDEYLIEWDEDQYEARLAHFRDVLRHHGFTDHFITLFIENISPTSECIPKHFDILPEELYDEDFDDTPFSQDEEIDLMGMPDGSIENFSESLRLSKPVLPDGWLAVFKHLKLPVIENNNFENQFKDPFFYSSDAGRSIPVYICGPCKSPYDEEDPAANQIKKDIAFSIRGKHDTAILFYSAPISCGEIDGKHVTYWGDIYIDSQWRSLVLNQDSTSIEAIILQAKQTHSREVDLMNPKLTEISLDLIGVWADNNIDPLLDVFKTRH